MNLIDAYFAAHRLERVFTEIRNEMCFCDLKYIGGKASEGHSGVILTPSGVEIITIDFISRVLHVKFDSVVLTKRVNALPIVLETDPTKEIPKIVIESMEALRESFNKNFPSQKTDK